MLREKIHFVLREHPEILVYVIGTGDGDFHEVVKTLQAQGKQVILWTTRRSVSRSYGGACGALIGSGSSGWRTWSSASPAEGELD